MTAYRLPIHRLAAPLDLGAEVRFGMAEEAIGKCSPRASEPEKLRAAVDGILPAVDHLVGEQTSDSVTDCRSRQLEHFSELANRLIRFAEKAEQDLKFSWLPALKAAVGVDPSPAASELESSLR